MLYGGSLQEQTSAVYLVAMVAQFSVTMATRLKC